MNDKHIWRGKPSTEDECSSEQIRQRGGDRDSVMGHTKCGVKMVKEPVIATDNIRMCGYVEGGVKHRNKSGTTPRCWAIYRRLIRIG